MNATDRNQDVVDAAAERSIINRPNSLCLLRLIGSMIMLVLAFTERAQTFLIVFLVTASTDWIDGRLARWLKQRTTFGARLDSVADAAMYGSLLFGCLWMKGPQLATQTVWIVAALSCYVLSCAASLIRFRRLPSHHTYSAKAAWFLTVVASVVFLADWAAWPLSVAMTAVAIANLESTLITIISVEWRSDVPTFWHAWH